MTVHNNLQLHGFNNLTKSLSISVYLLHYVNNKNNCKYKHFINARFNAEALTAVLTQCCEIIGANILNTAIQNYQPHGASVTLLVEEQENAAADPFENSNKPGKLPSNFVAHLDKSHICIHTYPETRPINDIATFRLDIEIASCGVISPLKALNFLISYFKPEIATIDYRVRGFTRDVKGKKHFIDHKINQISDFLSDEHQEFYQIENINFSAQNLFYSKVKKRKNELATLFFAEQMKNLTTQQKQEIKKNAEKEINDLYYPTI